MRSVIDEIATAEQQAEEIRQNASVQARDLSLQAKEDAQAALAALENQERDVLLSALESAKLEGERLSETLHTQLEQETDALCARASERLNQAVSYLLDKVIKTA